VNSPQTDRRPPKLRRTGRHATPSQVQKVTQKAGKAAPAMAIAGALIAAPQVAQAATVQAHAGSQAHSMSQAPAQDTAAVKAVKAPAQGAAEARPIVTDALVEKDQGAIRAYTVKSGDTLSSIAKRFYGNAADWPALFEVNKSVLRNPNVIDVGQRLQVPQKLPHVTAYTPKHAKPATVLTSSATLSGTLSCTGLEELWEQGGGSSGEAFMAASIAMAESGGQEFATGSVGERGYWQINPDHGSLSTYDPLGNAQAAVTISGDGANWTPWTTFTSGAYRGRC
jgi:LysM repeat protein